MVFTENDYKILKAIIDRNNEKKGLCKSNGTSIKELVDKTQLSDKKVRQTIKRFLEVEFIVEGASIVKAKTYILTTKGFEELNSLRLNIFGR
jgi:predicted transcriptional regulator